MPVTINEAVTQFLAVVPQLTVAQLSLVQNALLVEATKRLYQ